MGLPAVVGKLREAKVCLSRGASVAEVVKALAISEVTALEDGTASRGLN